MKYIMAEWEESRGDKFDHWGKSIWFIELDDNLYPNRQIEVYHNGTRLKYSDQNKQDNYGQLGDQLIDAKDGWGEEISKSRFEKEWTIKAYNNQ